MRRMHPDAGAHRSHPQAARSAACGDPIVWACAGLSALVTAEIVLAVPMPADDGAGLLGSLAAVAAGCFGAVAVLGRSSYRRSMAAVADEATARSVAGSRRRRAGWHLLDTAHPTERSGRLRVLVGPTGVYVIESRWAPNECTLVRGGIAGTLGREPVAGARRGARAVEHLLRRDRPDLDVAVHPMVVLWGPGGLRLDAGWTTVDGVLVCEGRSEERWLGQLHGPELDRSTVDRLCDALGGFRTTRADRPEPAVSG